MAPKAGRVQYLTSCLKRPSGNLWLNSASGLATFQNQFCGMTRFIPVGLQYFVILFLRFVKLLPNLLFGVFCQEVERDLLTIIDIESRIQLGQNTICGQNANPCLEIA